MHEAAITQALLEQVLEHVPEGSTLTEVRIDVGELEHLDAEVMRTLWAVTIADTPAAGSRIRIERIPLRVRCLGCGREYRPEEPAFLLCPFCERVLPEVLSGAGVVLTSLEVEEGPS